MSDRAIFLKLGDTLYRADFPWAKTPAGTFKVSDVATDGRGHVYLLVRRNPFVNDGGPAIYEFAPDGRQVAAFGEEVVDAHYLTVASDGRILVVDRDANEVVIFDRQGRRIGGLGGRHRPGEPFNSPTGVGVAPSGDIYVTDGYGGSQVHRFAPDGALRLSWGEPGAGPGQFSTPHGVVILPPAAPGEGERVVVADRENNRLQVFTPEGEFQEEWGDHFHPMDLDIDRDGNLLVTDQIPRLSVVAPDGRLVGRARSIPTLAHGLSQDPEGAIFLAIMNLHGIAKLVPQPA